MNIPISSASSRPTHSSLRFDLEIARVMLVAILGGLLGILMMIPLRRALIVDQHGLLKYPEGTACAAVLIASEDLPASPDSNGNEDKQVAGGGKTIFSGFGIGFIYYVIDKALFGWKEIPEKIFGVPFEGGSVCVEIHAALVCV